MANIITNSRITKDGQFFFINDQEIAGVQSFTASVQNSANPLKCLGGNFTLELPTGPNLGSVSISSVMLGPDPFIVLTGDYGVNGYLLKDQTSIAGNLSFSSGYLTNYRARYSVEELPQIDADFAIFDNIGTFPQLYNTKVNNDFNSILSVSSNLPSPKISAPGFVDLNLPELSTNRVNNFDISIACKRNPIYFLATNSADITEQIPILAIPLIYPIEIVCNFQIEIDSYTFNNLKDFPEITNNKNISLTIKDFRDSSVINSYSFNNLNLINYSYNINVNSDAIINLSYRGFANR